MDQRILTEIQNIFPISYFLGLSPCPLSSFLFLLFFFSFCLHWWIPVLTEFHPIQSNLKFLNDLSLFLILIHQPLSSVASLSQCPPHGYKWCHPNQNSKQFYPNKKRCQTLELDKSILTRRDRERYIHGAHSKAISSSHPRDSACGRISYTCLNYRSVLNMLHNEEHHWTYQIT